MTARRTERGQDPTTDIPDRLARDIDRDDLSRLVREVNDGGVSYQDMADRAAAAGHKVSKPYMQKIAANNVTTAPSDTRLEAIAAAIGRPVALVKRAAAIQWLAYDATELSGYGDDIRIIVAHLAGMDRPDVRKWRAMIEAAEAAEVEDD
ncbi:hypothetical protein HHL19_36230 [Streptomyces sp. R302]|uniref:hypothetical protein n=1 Tax=unclassified Streptomyces TaxID=2593676 RepID=UPI00145E2588|nr:MULTISPECIES: hypothetical protein [unclassified Streptomyces]NML55699.1 hypothetical protein [Streptomyces sp. R301]NML83959.1 hypothetical protein [Streptomyces sp. R302]